MKPRLKLEKLFIVNAEELLELLMESVKWDERMRTRKTASFGEPYNYSGISYPKSEMPDALDKICVAVEDRLGFRPNNCLLNYYPNGDSSMGFHSDDITILAPNTGVAIVSLGSERVISYRAKADPSHTVDYCLPAGSLLYMDDEVQTHWKHGIPKSADAGSRISLTFRKIR